MSDKSDTPIHQQAVFTDNGDLEPEADSVETSLEAFGAEVDHRQRESQLDCPTATEFGVDDRPEANGTDAGEQHALFADTDSDQRTLEDKSAATRFLFEDCVSEASRNNES